SRQRIESLEDVSFVRASKYSSRRCDPQVLGFLIGVYAIGRPSRKAVLGAYEFPRIVSHPVQSTAGSSPQRPSAFFYQVPDLTKTEGIERGLHRDAIVPDVSNAFACDRDPETPILRSQERRNGAARQWRATETIPFREVHAVEADQ